MSNSLQAAAGPGPHPVNPALEGEHAHHERQAHEQPQLLLRDCVAAVDNHEGSHHVPTNDESRQQLVEAVHWHCDDEERADEEAEPPDLHRCIFVSWSQNFARVLTACSPSIAEASCFVSIESNITA